MNITGNLLSFLEIEPHAFLVLFDKDGYPLKFAVGERAAEIFFQEVGVKDVDSTLARIFSPLRYEYHRRRITRAARMQRDMNFDTWVKVPAGERRLNVQLVPVSLFPEHSAIWAVYRDITEEVTQRRKERLNACNQALVGRLEIARTIVRFLTHDLNNKMASLFGYTKLLQEEKGLSDEVRTLLNEIDETNEDILALVERLSFFCRGSHASRDVVCIDGLFEDAAGFLRKQGYHVDVVGDTFDARAFVAGELLHSLWLSFLRFLDSAPFMRSACRVRLFYYPVHVSERASSSTGNVAPGKYALLGFHIHTKTLLDDMDDSCLTPYAWGRNGGVQEVLAPAALYGLARQYGGRLTLQRVSSRSVMFQLFLPLDRETDAMREIKYLPVGGGNLLLLDAEGDPSRVADFLRTLRYVVAVRRRLPSAFRALALAPEPYQAIVVAGGFSRNFETLLEGLSLARYPAPIVVFAEDATLLAQVRAVMNGEMTHYLAGSLEELAESLPNILQRNTALNV